MLVPVAPFSRRSPNLGMGNLPQAPAPWEGLLEDIVRLPVGHVHAFYQLPTVTEQPRIIDAAAFAAKGLHGLELGVPTNLTSVA